MCSNELTVKRLWTSGEGHILSQQKEIYTFKLNTTAYQNTDAWMGEWRVEGNGAFFSCPQIIFIKWTRKAIQDAGVVLLRHSAEPMKRLHLYYDLSEWKTSDFIDFSKRLFFISSRWLARSEKRETFKAQTEWGFEVSGNLSYESPSMQKTFPRLLQLEHNWDFFFNVGVIWKSPLPAKDAVPVRTLLPGLPPDCSCPALAAAPRTTTRYVVLWEYWKLSIAPNREISAWLVHAFGPTGKSHSPGCVGGSPGGSWPNWSRWWGLCCPPQWPAGPPDAVGKRGAGEMPKRPPMGSKGDYNSPPRLKFRAWRFGIIG